MRTWLPSRRYRRRPLVIGDTPAGRVYRAARRAAFPYVELPAPRPWPGMLSTPSGFAIAAGEVGWRRFLLTAGPLELELAARVLAACEQAAGATKDETA